MSPKVKADDSTSGQQPDNDGKNRTKDVLPGMVTVIMLSYNYVQVVDQQEIYIW